MALKGAWDGGGGSAVEFLHSVLINWEYKVTEAAEEIALVLNIETV